MSGNGEVRSTKGGDELWNRDKIFKNPRPPKGLEMHNTNGVSTTSSAGSQKSNLDAIISTSRLNVNAEEFVPRHHSGPQIPAAEDMSYLAEAIEVLTMNPGRYQEFLPPIEDIVETVIHDKNAVGQIVTVVIDQCVIESNFRYTGARLCGDLAAKFYLEFVNCLLEKCCHRFTQLTSLLETQRERVLGFGLTLAELFLQVTIDNGSHIGALANGLLQILGMLLDVPAYDTIRAVCQIIKLCYVPLERDGISLQPIFQTLENLAESPMVEENARRVIAGLLHLRRTEWSRQAPEIVSPIQPQVEHYGNEPVFYSPDGQVMSEEERSFLLDNIPVSDDLDDYIVENEMDEEADAAFDEFLSLYSKNNQLHQHHHPGYGS